jgi:hypothetical protein
MKTGEKGEKKKEKRKEEEEKENECQEIMKDWRKRSAVRSFRVKFYYLV